jgi:outer membrane protein assembly factor BamB
MPFDKGKVFVATFDGLVLSFDAATGSRMEHKLPGSYGFVTAPTATNGVVYVGDGGSNSVVALDAVERRRPLERPRQRRRLQHSSRRRRRRLRRLPVPVLRPRAATGAERWHYNGPAPARRRRTVPVAQGSAYVRDFDS